MLTARRTWSLLMLCTLLLAIAVVGPAGAQARGEQASTNIADGTVSAGRSAASDRAEEDARGSLVRGATTQGSVEAMHQAAAEAEGTSASGTPQISRRVSHDPVAPGDTFTYTIDVGNTEACTMTEVRVEHETSGPVGSQVTSTTPRADDVDEDLTVRWNDVGNLAPGEGVQLRIDVSVPADAADGAQYFGALNLTADCGGERSNVHVDFVAAPTVQAATSPQPVQTEPDLPKTGPTFLVAAALAFMVLGGGLWRLALAPPLERRRR